MKYEDLKESFKFKTQEGKGALTFTADKKSKHIWTVSTENSVMGPDWDCEDMLEHFNSGAWVIQDEDQIEEIHEVQKQAKTLRDEFAMAALTGWLASQPLIKGIPISENVEDAELMTEVAYVYADAMLQARKESL